MSAAGLLDEWGQLAAERLALYERLRDHGVNSKAAERLRHKDRVVCDRLAEVGERLRELGVDPPLR